MPIHDDTHREKRLDNLEEMVRNMNPAKPKDGGAGQKDRKPLLEHKAVQNIAQSGEDKHKFKEWNIKFVNSMGQVDPHHEQALICVMKRADAEVMPDTESVFRVAAIHLT